MPGSKKLIDIIDEMNMKEADFKDRIIRKLNKLASLIFNVDKNTSSLPSSDLLFVNSLLEEIINGKEIVRPELEKCNRIYKQYKELKRNGFTANNS